MDFTRDELETAAVIVIIGEDGLFKWSTTRPLRATAAIIRNVAADVDTAAEDEPDAG